MLGSLRVRNFRMLKDFEVGPLGRVNLIVGQNNSGKSTVLEALRIMAANGHPSVLEQIALEHGEKTLFRRQAGLDELLDLPYHDFFTGRKFPDDDLEPIYIGEAGDSPDRDYVEISHVFYTIEKEEVTDADGDLVSRSKRMIIARSDLAENDLDEVRQGLRIIGSEGLRPLFVSLDSSSRRSAADKKGFDDLSFGSASFIPTQFISIDDLAEIWDRIVFSDHAEWVKRGLSILADDFEDLAFVSSGESLPDRFNRQQAVSERKCMVKLKGLQGAVPLNSLGDGMLRILQLMLKIYPAKGGYLLIDEFENGLHYSVQEKVWALLFELSELLDFQVFATTHSRDCVESFAKVANERKDMEGVLFRVGRSVLKSNTGQVIATVFDEKKLAAVTQAELEVR